MVPRHTMHTHKRMGLFRLGRVASGGGHGDGDGGGGVAVLDAVYGLAAVLVP